MSNGGLAKATAKTAADVVGAGLPRPYFPLGDEAKKLLRDGMAPRAFLDVLIEKQQFPDAVRFLAHALPKREAVWWACLCARQAYGASPPAPMGPALTAAEKWVSDPSEPNRRAAHTAAEAAGMGAPAGCAAMAAFFSGGSLAPPNAPAVPPGEHLTAHAAAGAVMLAAVMTEPQKAPEKYRKFFALGIDVGNGVNKWK
ncbi:MAG TPA: hypothetical protein VMS17_10625 [Gemmataceae bacterium]|nr:hypothetical protein [Gemmataceae bacterium]